MAANLLGDGEIYETPKGDLVFHQGMSDWYWKLSTENFERVTIVLICNLVSIFNSNRDMPNLIIGSAWGKVESEISHNVIASFEVDYWGHTKILPIRQGKNPTTKTKNFLGI